MQQFIRWLIHLFLLTSVIIATTNGSTVHLGAIGFYDQFGDEVPDMIYTHGYLLIECFISVCQLSDSIVELVISGVMIKKAAVANRACENKVVFRLDITESIKFGHYRCKYSNQESDKFNLWYRFCSPLDEACSQACRNDGAEYCLITVLGPKPCIINADVEILRYYCFSYSGMAEPTADRVKYCGAEQYGNCDVTGKQPPTLCMALLKGSLRNARTQVFDPNVTAKCFLKNDNKPNVERENAFDRPLAYPRLVMGGTQVRYNEILTRRDVRDPIFYLPVHYKEIGITMNCKLKARGGTVMWHDEFKAKDHAEGTPRYDYMFAEFISDLVRDGTMFTAESGIGLYKLMCTFLMPDETLLADIAFYVIANEGKALIIANTTEDGRYTRTLTCEPMSALPSGFAIESYEWIMKSGQSYGAEKKFMTESNEFVPEKNGIYYCEIHVTVRCRRSVPRAEAHLRSGEIPVTPMPQETTTSSRANGRKGLAVHLTIILTMIVTVHKI